MLCSASGKPQLVLIQLNPIFRIYPIASSSILCTRSRPIYYAQPEQAAGIVGPVVNLINSLTFTDQKVISPFYIQFAQKPKNDVIIFKDLPGKHYDNKELYLRDIVKINLVGTKIRLAHIQARKYVEPTDKVKRYQEQIPEGSIVSIKNPEIVVRRQNFKLRPKFKITFWSLKGRLQPASYYLAQKFICKVIFSRIKISVAPLIIVFKQISVM